MLQSWTKLLEKVFPIMSTLLCNKTTSKMTPLHKENPYPNLMLLATNAQGSGFLLNTWQHCFQGKGEREELVQLQCLEECPQVCNFLNSFVQDCSCSLPQWWAVKRTFFTPCEYFFLLLARPLSLPMLFIAVILYTNTWRSG